MSISELKSQIKKGMFIELSISNTLKRVILTDKKGKKIEVYEGYKEIWNYFNK